MSRVAGMWTRGWVIALASILGACHCPPKDPADISRAQAKLAADTAQARLWEQTVASGAAIKTAVEYSDTGMVRTRTPVKFQDHPAGRSRRLFPQGVAAAARIISVPASLPFRGSAIVDSVTGEVLTLGLDDGETMQLQAKVRGGPLNVAPADSARVYFQFSDDPFARNDVLTLGFSGDAFWYALVGGDEPIDFQLDTALGLEQLGERDTVRVSLGCEQRTLTTGDQWAFPGAGLTAKLLASTAHVRGDSVAVEGDPYRVSLLAWQTVPGPPPPGPPVSSGICGYVTSSADGSPIVGALVETSPATATALSDAQGYFEITGFPIASSPTLYAVTASSLGCTSASASVSLRSPWHTLPTARVDLVLTCSP